MRDRKAILFLYSELAEYLLVCIRKLLELYDVEIHIVHWELNEQAPFEFDIPENVSLYAKDELEQESLHGLVNQINPDLVYSSGWMDKDYVKVCKHLRKKNIPVVAGIDNRWQGTFKQYLAKLVSPFTIKMYFSHLWVAGAPQRKYAQKLGFSESHILSGLYSADVDFFRNLCRKKKENTDETLHRFIYVGRYIKRKGLLDLWQAFINFRQENESDWELWCLGTGPLQKRATEHPKIKHFGFVQPEYLPQYVKETDVFILPSHWEPWGVVVHEFAAAGFPLICSDNVGAATAFLEDGKNGYIFESGNITELKEAMHRIADLSRSDLKKMGNISAKKSESITPRKWSEIFMSVLN